MKKFTNSKSISDYEVLTDTGWEDIKNLHTTIPYEVYHLKLKDGKELKCADNHIVFKQNYNELTFEPDGLIECFVKDLEVNDYICISPENGYPDEGLVIEITNLGYKEEMYDLELSEKSNKRYYTNGILSHNTQLVKVLSKYLFDNDSALIRIDMSEYMEKFAVSRLIGAPPGYVGYEEGGQLTEAVRRKPYSVILLDEIEKAHPDVFNLLLQALDDGQMTDSLGRKIDFKNTIIIMTSNIGARKIKDFGTGVGFMTSAKEASVEDDMGSVIDGALKQAFAPEFLNRIDDVVIFNSLSREDIHKIIEIELESLYNRIRGLGYIVKLTEEAKDFIADKGYDIEFGARPLKRAIQKYLEDPLAEEIVGSNISEGDIISISLEASENIKIKISKPKSKKDK